MSAPSAPRWRRPPRTLLAGLLVATALLIATTVPGIFILDEAHQLVMAKAVSEARLTVANTAGLPPSRELLYFEPAARTRRVDATPVVATVPPLHALFASPLLHLGWRGLAAINAVSFVGAALLVFLLAGRYAERRSTAALAASTFALCGYGLEYAQGLWPHMLAVFLVVAALAATAVVRDGGSGRWAFLAGLLAGTAAGVRYQNVVVVLGLALGLVALAPRRWARLAAYAGGAAIPLGLCSVINFLRLGYWNPVSKGPRHFTLEVLQEGWTLLAAVRAFLFRVVSSGFGVEIPGLPYERFDPEVGVFLHGAVVKKAWLQSGPWIVVGLLVVLAAWFSSRWVSHAAQRRELKAGALVLGPVLLTFVLAGAGRHDGLSYNQRYLLELVPIVALGLAWFVESLDERRRREMAIGALLAAVAASWALWHWPPGHPQRVRFVAWVPLVLAAALLVSAVVRRLRAGQLFPALIGAGLAYAAVVHLGEDWVASRSRRAANLVTTLELEAAIPDRAALFAYWGAKDPASLLVFSRDVVIVDPWIDGGADAPMLLDALLASGRRVFVLGNGLPATIGRPLLSGRLARVNRSGRLTLVEVLAPAAGVSAGGG